MLGHNWQHYLKCFDCLSEYNSAMYIQPPTPFVTPCMLYTAYIQYLTRQTSLTHQYHHFETKIHVIVFLL